MAVQKDLLFQHIQWKPQGPVTKKEKEKMQSFFEKWAEQMTTESPQKLEDFVCFMTDSRSIGPESLLKLELYKNRDPEQYLIAHTCSFTVEMQLYETQEAFNKHINEALTTIEAGFQFT